MQCCCGHAVEEPVPEEKEAEEKKVEEPQTPTDGTRDGEEYRITIDRTKDMEALGVSVYKGPWPLAGLIRQVKKGMLAARALVESGDRILACNGVRDFNQVLGKIATDRILELRLKRPKRYNMKVSKGGGLGLSLKYCNDEDFLFIEEIHEGAVAALNRKYEDREVRVLDCIVEVNGVKDSVSAMLEEISATDFLALTILRWHSKAELLRLLSEAREAGQSPLSGKWTILGRMGDFPAKQSSDESAG